MQLFKLSHGFSSMSCCSSHSLPHMLWVFCRIPTSLFCYMVSLTVAARNTPFCRTLIAGGRVAALQFSGRSVSKPGSTFSIKLWTKPSNTPLPWYCSFFPPVGVWSGWSRVETRALVTETGRGAFAAWAAFLREATRERPTHCEWGTREWRQVSGAGARWDGASRVLSASVAAGRGSSGR